MKKVLVTGATGFIGTYLVDHLCQKGIEVRCLVRKTSNVSQLTVPASGQPSQANLIEQVVGDLSDPSSLHRATDGVDGVFHLAGITKTLRKKELWQVNQTGTRNLAEACRNQNNPPALVLVSSLAAAGPVVADTNPAGLHELDKVPAVSGFRPRVEQDPCEPVSNYGRSKLDGERAAADVFSASMLSQFPLSIVRPPIVFGPRDRDVFAMFKPIHQFGIHVVNGIRASLFSAIHVEDLSSALLAVLLRGKRYIADDQSQGIYFASHPEHMTYADLGRTAGRALGRRGVLCVPTPNPIVRATAGINQVVSYLRGQPHILGWDKSREAITRGWASNPNRLIKECQIRFPYSMQQRFDQTANWYRENGWL